MGTQHLSGKSVIVTGAGGGLGRAYALELARQGASLVVNDVDDARAADVANEVTELGGRAEVVAGSVADWSVAERLVQTCADSYGSVDGLVNNAGLLRNALPWEEDEASLRRLVDVNVLGSLFCGVNALRQMTRQGTGAIVGVTSGTLGGTTGVTTYGTTKGAVASMIYGWALESGPLGVRVNGLMPMAVTGMTAQRSNWIDSSNADPGLKKTQTGQGPEKVAPLVAFLLSDRAAGINGRIVRHDGRRITLATRPTWTGGHELRPDDELGFEEMAEVVEKLVAER